MKRLKQALSLGMAGVMMTAAPVTAFAASPEFSAEEGYKAEAIHARFEAFERMKLSQEQLVESICDNMQGCCGDDLFSQVLYLANLSGALSLTARRLLETLPEKADHRKKQIPLPDPAAEK